MYRTVMAFLVGLVASSAHAPALARPAVSAAPRDTFHVGMLLVEHRGTVGKPPLIFIPALFCGPWQWERELATLANRYDLYALTLPGFDGRPRDRGGDLMARAVADIATLIDTHQLDRPLLVGHSLGGTLAVLFAETRPLATRAVIAVEGGYPAGATSQLREQSVAASTAPYVGLRGAAFGAALRANMLQYVITRPADVDRVEQFAERSDAEAVIDWMRAAFLLDLTPGLARVTVPLTEIVPFDPKIDPYQGYASLDAKRAAYEAWLGHAPRGTVVMIAAARHFVMLDQPEEFDRVLYDAIARVTNL